MEYFGKTSNSDALMHLVEFEKRLIEAKNFERDPDWYIVNIFGGRFGCGSKGLLKGTPVDPKSNPIHRFAIQYIHDEGLLKRLCSSNEVLVIAVSYFSSDQEVFNRSALAYAKCDKLALISLRDESVVSMLTAEQITIKKGDVCCIPLTNRSLVESIRMVKGACIAIAFGWPEPYGTYKSKSLGSEPMNAIVELESLSYEGIVTKNRKASVKGMYQPVIACPDCRRPVEVRCVTETTTPIDNENEKTWIVTVCCDSEEVAAAIDIGTKQEGDVVFVTDDSLITDELKKVWRDVRMIRPIRKYLQKRGLQDYAVPDGYVSPVLFPRAADPPIKETIYTIIQAIGEDSLADKRILLRDPSNTQSVVLVASKRVYSQMMCELRDWHHPCHRGRRSAITFIKEWISVYN